MNLKSRLVKLETSHRTPKIPDNLPELTDAQLEAFVAGETDSPLLMTLADRQPLTDEQFAAVVAGRSLEELSDNELLFLIVGHDKP